MNPKYFAFQDPQGLCIMGGPIKPLYLFLEGFLQASFDRVKKIVKQVSPTSPEPKNENVSYPISKQYFEEHIKGPILNEVKESQCEM